MHKGGHLKNLQFSLKRKVRYINVYKFIKINL